MPRPDPLSCPAPDPLWVELSVQTISALALTSVCWLQAIDFLRQRDQRLAVHFAIPLAHYGLLQTADRTTVPMRT